MLYLKIHSTHFIYGVMASDIWYICLSIYLSVCMSVYLSILYIYPAIYLCIYLSIYIYIYIYVCLSVSVCVVVCVCVSISWCVFYTVVPPVVLIPDCLIISINTSASWEGIRFVISRLLFPNTDRVNGNWILHNMVTRRDHSLKSKCSYYMRYRCRKS